MAFVLLSQASGFNSGADLWAVPDLNASKLVQRLDWYINFQLSRATLHTQTTISEPVLKILAATDLPQLGPQNTSKSRYLVGTDALLPNRWTLYLTGSQKFEKWVKELIEVWQELGHPTLRVFLPAGITLTDFQSAWHDTPTPADIYLVPAESAT